jgi:hypothetical protein
MRAIMTCAVASLVFCACGPLEPGRLPTAEEECAMHGGYYRANVCHTNGGQ